MGTGVGPNHSDQQNATLRASHNDHDSNIYRVIVPEASGSRVVRGAICRRYLLLDLTNAFIPALTYMHQQIH